MVGVLAVGGSHVPGTMHSDVWAPVLILVSLVLVRLVARLGLTWRTVAAASAGGVLWAWSLDPFGAVTTSSVALLVAFGAGAAVNAVDAARKRRAS